MFRNISATLLWTFWLICIPSWASADGLLQTRFIRAPSRTSLPPLQFSDDTGRFSRNLSELKGQWILLNLWATWCAPCTKELPSLDKIQSLLGPRNLLVIALAQDAQGEITVPFFFKRHRIRNLAVALDRTGSSASLLKASGLPTTLLINPDGYEVGRVSGQLDWAKAENIAYLNRLLEGNALLRQ